MLISLAGTPSAFAFYSSLQYGEADGISLYLSMFYPFFKSILACKNRGRFEITLQLNRMILNWETR